MSTYQYPVVLWINNAEPEDPIYEIVGPFFDEDGATAWAVSTMNALDILSPDHAIEFHVMTCADPGQVRAGVDLRAGIAR